MLNPQAPSLSSQALSSSPPAGSPGSWRGEREASLLSGLDLGCSLGVEIGPLDRPLLSKSDGKVLYIDHLPAERLQAIYKDDPHVDCSSIHVDIALMGRPLSKFFSGGFLADYIVASHVIEHVPNLVAWLKELRSVLRDTGEVRLAVPDKRFTFDFLRHTSTLADVLASYFQGSKSPQPREVFDFLYNSVILDLQSAWKGTIRREHLVHTRQKDAYSAAQQVAQDSTLLEVHCWVFTPQSFALLMAGLAQYKLLDFRCSAFFDTRPNSLEFIVAMTPCRDPARIQRSWQDVAAQVHHFDPEFKTRQMAC